MLSRSFAPCALILALASMVSIASADTDACGALSDARGIAPPAGIAAPVAPPSGTRDYPELSGWPTSMQVDVNYAPVGGPATVDVDHDGRLEVFAGSTDRKLYGWRIDGTALPGFPITLSGRIQSSPSVGDIDGDGTPEILILTYNGYVYAFHANGTAVTGWPLHPGQNGAMISLVLQDFDGDNIPEIVLPNGNNLYVWRGNGTNYPGFPVTYQSAYGACSTPAVGDIDGDGTLEIVVEGWEWMSVFHQNGTMAAGWPYHLPLSYEGFSYASPVLIDFDADGRKEIAAAYHESGAGNWSGKVCVWRYNGTVAPGWPYVMSDFGSWCYSTPAVGDVDGDGLPEFAMNSHNGNIYLFNFDGTLVPGFPVYTGYVNLEAASAVADIDDDARLEILFGSNNTPGVYFSFEPDGSTTPGFPLAMTGAMMPSGSCIMDADLDGHINISVHDKAGKVHMWNLPFAIHADRIPFGRPFHDDFHTGNMAWRNPAAAGDLPAGLRLVLDPAWPNPSNGAVSFRLRSAEAADVRVIVIDAAGRCVSVLSDGALAGGERRLRFDPLLETGRPLPGGIYYIRAQSGRAVSTRSFTLIR